MRKNRETLSFSGDAMMYAAIFSDNALYKCNVQRMMKRLAIQTEMNIRRAEQLGFDGCETGSVRSSLIALKSATENNMLLNVGDLSKEVKGDNPSNCPIF
ncbi:MAG: hypothetical protein KKE23_00825 [Nanoarchaeota archaeon]|nr:hypothetical protein [Nanoarchaeota archaeon]